ncbi:hypothetical protein SJPD1_0942 [Sulfurospirillum diekertiae]|uniref:Peptidoglycan binding-like domain-containing protein n=1 Tax=Sulfurospirillum diekertiae TaxID=1854492 RepID=A0A290HQY4_9BACT|nr:peptidoglycan-binding protein [Sulfurospirillum diekertiae]ATB69054.1 hypothetical protein SJPD1_0942 [Sulfurospirillum diekertiae]
MFDKIKFLLAILWGILIFAIAVSVEIAWLGFLIGSVLGVILMLIFFPTGFLLPFNFIMSFGLFSGALGYGLLDGMTKKYQKYDENIVIDLPPENIHSKIDNAFIESKKLLQEDTKYLNQEKNEKSEPLCEINPIYNDDLRESEIEKLQTKLNEFNNAKKTPIEWSSVMKSWIIAILIALFFAILIISTNSKESLDKKIGTTDYQKQSNSEIDNKLKQETIKVSSESISQNYFSIGSSRSLVEKLQGTPKNILNNNEWAYPEGIVYFQSDKVTGYYNKGGLKVNDNNVNNKEVEYIEKKPTLKNENEIMSLAETRWCQAENIRIEAIREKYGNQFPNPDLEIFNTLIKNKNSLCNAKSFIVDLEQTKVEIEKRKTSIKKEGIASFTSKIECYSVQEKLNQFGFDTGLPDGIFGSKTRAAIISFQKQNGLSTTGVIDKKLLEVLKI